MSDTAETLEEIREQKRQEIEQETGDQMAHQSGTPASAPDEPIHIKNEEHLQEVVEKYDVVLTDFHADWCGPCKMLEPIVKELAVETDAAMAKVDVDKLQRLAQQHRVQGVPTMILFAQGEVAERIVGVREKHALEQLIDRHSA